MNENLSKVTLSFKEESAKRATTTKQLDENSKRLIELEKNIESLQEENSKLKAMLKNNKNNTNTNAKPAAATDISGISKLSEAEKVSFVHEQTKIFFSTATFALSNILT